MEVERPLIHAQIHGDAIVGADFHVSFVILYMDVFRRDRDFFALRFLENGGADILGGLSIHSRQSGGTFKGILELVIAYEDRNYLHADINHPGEDGQHNNGFQPSRAALALSQGHPASDTQLSALTGAIHVPTLSRTAAAGSACGPICGFVTYARC